MKGESWLDDVMSEVLHVETPRSWIWWSLVSAISASAGNNYEVISFKGNVTYKPNLYVILLGDSGLGKAFPINLSKLLVQAADVTRVIAGRSSVQGIVKEISTSRSRENGNIPFTDARAFIVNGELSSAVVTDTEALSMLTDLYDGTVNEKWDSLLKGEGLTKLKEPYITALFGSSQAHFYEKIPQANIDGGYIGRNLIVYEEKRFQYVDPFDIDDADITNRVKEFVVPEFSRYLIEISKKRGRILLNTPAKELFNSWRKKWRDTQQKEKTGFVNRVPDHVIKVSMCICLARYNNDMMINEFDMNEAIERVTSLMYANKMSTEGKGLDPLATQTKFVLNQLIAAEGHELRQKLLLSRGLGMYQSDGLNKILETLLEMGWVVRERIVAGKSSDWMIKLHGEPLESYQKYQNQKDNKK